MFVGLEPFNYVGGAREWGETKEVRKTNTIPLVLTPGLCNFNSKKQRAMRNGAYERKYGEI